MKHIHITVSEKNKTTSVFLNDKEVYNTNQVMNYEKAIDLIKIGYNASKNKEEIDFEHINIESIDD